mgnify:CR=1 FL=1
MAHSSFVRLLFSTAAYTLTDLPAVVVVVAAYLLWLVALLVVVVVVVVVRWFCWSSLWLLYFALLCCTLFVLVGLITVAGVLVCCHVAVVVWFVAVVCCWSWCERECRRRECRDRNVTRSKLCGHAYLCTTTATWAALSRVDCMYSVHANL